MDRSRPNRRRAQLVCAARFGGHSAHRRTVADMHRTRRQYYPAHAIGATLIATAVSLLPLPVPLATEAVASGGAGVELGVALSRPHVLDGDVADVIVRVYGSSVCSGTPITGTRYVVTAAHCILDGAGSVTTTPTVVRDSVDYVPLAVLVNPRYDDAPDPQLDAAVLIMDRAIPGPGATLGDTLAPHDVVTLAGIQPLDTDGTLLRGTSYHDRPLPQGVTGGVVHIESVPAGCVGDASSVEMARGERNIPCGLVRGASGGGLFTERGGGPILLGVIATVTFDLSVNGLTPLTAIHALFDHPDVYTHLLAEDRPIATAGRTTRS